jgi:hypothetical protein
MNQAVVITLLASLFVAIALPAWVLLSGKQSTARIRELEKAVIAEKAQAREKAQAEARLKARAMREEGIIPTPFLGVDFEAANAAENALARGHLVVPSGMKAMTPTAMPFPSYGQHIEAMIGRATARATETKPVRDEA